ERDAVWSGEVFADQLQLAFVDREDSAERQLLARVVKELWQTKRRIGEVQRSVRAVNKIVRAVESFSFKVVREHGLAAVLFIPHESTIAVLIDCEVAFGIKRQPVRTGLSVLGNVRPRVTARRAKDFKLARSHVPVWHVLINDVAVWIAEQKILPFGIPDRTFG